MTVPQRPDARSVIRAYLSDPAAKGLPPTAHAVLLALLLFMDRNGMARPSISSLAEIVGVNERNTQKALRAVEAAGFITADRRPGNITRYHLVYPEVGGRGVGTDRVSVATPPSDPPNPEVGGRGVGSDGVSVPTGVSVATPEVPREITTTPLTPRDFDEWWSVYPKKIGKGQARAAYVRALRKTDAATLLAGARLYARQRAGQDQRFTRNPATWLNGEGWEDETRTTTEGPRYGWN